MKTIYQLSKQHKLLKKEEQASHFDNFAKLLKLLDSYKLSYSPAGLKALKECCQDSEKKIILNGIKSKDLLIITNQGQVIKLASQYYNRFLCVDELIQIGNLGICKALLKFKPSKKTRFSSYAFFWIRAMMLDALKKIDPIYLPTRAKKDLKINFKYFVADEDSTKDLVYNNDTSLVDEVLLNCSKEDSKILELGLDIYNENHGSLALALHLGCSLEDSERVKQRTLQKLKSHYL